MSYVGTETYTVSVSISDSATPAPNPPAAPPAPEPSPPTSPFTLSISDPGNNYQHGSTVTLSLIGTDPFYSVNWEVDVPWDNSPNSSSFTYTSGGHDAYEAGTTYTFRSGSQYTGDYTFRVIIYSQWDVTREYEETYTVTVGY